MRLYRLFATRASPFAGGLSHPNAEGAGLHFRAVQSALTEPQDPTIFQSYDAAAQVNDKSCRGQFYGKCIFYEQLFDGRAADCEQNVLSRLRELKAVVTLAD